MAEFTLEEAYGMPAAKPKQRPYTPLNAPQPVPIETATPAVASELTPKPPPAGLTPKALNEYNLAEANRLAAMRIKQQEEERTGTSKAPEAFMAKAQKLKDFEGYLNDYKDELSKNKKVRPANIPLMPIDENTATITSKYTALLMGIKDAYQLGALTGPDMSLVESQLTNPASISGAITSRDAMKAQVDVLEGILKRSKENLESSYGKKMDLGVAKSSNPTGAPTGAPPDAKQAPDGNWYSPDPKRPGKYLQWSK